MLKGSSTCLNDNSKSILDTVNDIVLYMDLDGKIIDINKTIEKYGIPRSKVLNQSVFKFVRDENKIKEIKSILKDIKKDKLKYGELTVDTPFGEISLEYKATLISSNTSSYIQIILKDTTLVKKLEEDFNNIFYLSTKISPIVDREHLYWITYRELKKLIDFDYYIIGIYDKSKNMVTTEISIRDDFVLTKRIFKADPKKSLSGWIIHNKKSLLIKDMDQEDLPAVPIHRGSISRSWLGVPIIFDDEILGVLSLQSLEPNKFGERERKILENVARYLAISLINSSLYEELKEKKSEVEKELEKTLSILKHLSTGVAIVQDEKIVYSNDAFNKMLGYPNMIGMDIKDIIHPDMSKEMLEYYRKEILSGTTDFEGRVINLLTADGKTKWVQVKINPLKWKGTLAHLISIQDITSLKNMEDTLIALSKTFRDIKLAKSEEEIYDISVKALKNILNFNNAAIFKVDGNKLLLVKTIGYRIAHFEVDINGDKGVIAWVARNKRSLYIPDVTKEPLYIDTEANSRCEYATPIIIDGNVYGVLDVEGKEIDGISQEKRNLIDMLAQHMSVALKSLEKQKALEKAKNYQELMLRIVSHDLKNPLSVISGYVELMKEDYVPDYIEVIEKATERAFEIIEKARLFSKLGAKRIEGEKIEMNIREEIDAVSSMIKAKYPNAHIDIEMPSIKIYGYPLLKEVFMNILDNAFKYGAENVKVKCKENENSVILKIIDDGPGIPDDKKESIFDAFETLEHGGSGLGLNIVKMIVEMHNGKVWVEDNKPSGSIFVIELPNS